MTGKEFEQIIRISFERKKFTNLIIDKKLFRNFAHVYCKSAVNPGMFHYNLKKKTEVVKPFYGFFVDLIEAFQNVRHLGEFIVFAR